MKFRQSFQVFGNEKGQAVVEYVLILVITITMLAAAKGMFKAVDDFMYSYMGAYISCLMEYGELPAQGVEAVDLKKNKDGGTGGGKVCDSSFKNFNLANGISSNLSGGSGSNSSRNSASSKNSSQSATVSSKDKTPVSRPINSATDSANINSSSSYANGKVQRASNQSRAGSAGSADSGSQGPGDGKVRIIEDESGENGFGGLRSSNVGATEVNYEKVSYKAISGKLADAQKAKATRAPRAKIIQEIVDESRSGPRRSILAPPEKRAVAAVEDDGNGFSFGYFLKWIIIAGILISIFIFFGSQVMSFMNSKEK